jgi:hypothetical protein
MATFCIGLAELEPIIEIDSSESKSVERDMVLQKLYYCPGGYYKNAKTLKSEAWKEGYKFSLADIENWLYRQATWQVYAPGPKFIPRASFNTITIPNEVHQSDLCVIPPDVSGGDTYLYAQTIKDVASRFGWAVLRPNKESRLTVKIFENVYSNPSIPLTYPKVLISDQGTEFLGECKQFYQKHNIKHLQAKSKRGVGIIERFNRTLIEKVFPIQYAQEMLLPWPERSRVFSKILHPILNKLNNTPTRLIGMSPAVAIKKKHVYAMASKPRDGPIGFDEERLTYNDSVRYLLEPGELEGGRKRAGDLVWSPQIYHIKESFVQKNQPVLYWLTDEDDNGPSRSFVREELLLVKDVELPPHSILQ